MKLRKIKKCLQMKVKRYVEYMHDEEKSGSQKGEILFHNLSLKLRNELSVDIFIKILKNIKVMNNNFSKPFLEELSMLIKEYTFAPDEYIIRVFFFFFKFNNFFFFYYYFIIIRMEKKMLDFFYILNGEVEIYNNVNVNNSYKKLTVLILILKLI